VSGIRKIIKTVFLLALALAMMGMSLVAYWLFYTTGTLPSAHVRNASFFGSLATYGVFFLFGLIGLRLVLADFPGMAAATRWFDRRAMLVVLPLLVVFGFVVPLAIGG